MSDIIKFADREEFRKWLSGHCLTSSGVWLLFGKAGGPKTIKAGEALEEALCFGWIDGHIWMQRQMSGGKNESPGWWTDSIKT